MPDGYRNVPDLTKRFPDCCINIIKLENSTKIDENQTKIDTIPMEINVNQTRIDGNVTTMNENMIKFENNTKIDENVISDKQKKLR